MKEQLSQYGVAIVLLILILREVLPWALNVMKTNGKQVKTNGCVSRTEFDKHKDAVQYKDNCEQVQKTIKVQFDGLTTLTNQRFSAVEKGIAQVEKLIRNGGE